MAAPTVPPHFAAPAQLDSSGKFVTYEQDSPLEIASCVYNIMVCPQGFKIGDPTFGIPSELFATVPVDTAAILAALQRLEPRADLSITEVADAFNTAIRNLTVRVGVAG